MMIQIQLVIISSRLFRISKVFIVIFLVYFLQCMVYGLFILKCVCVVVMGLFWVVCQVLIVMFVICCFWCQIWYCVQVLWKCLVCRQLMEKLMIFGRCGMFMKVSRCNIVVCFMKLVIMLLWMVGRVGLLMLFLFVGRWKIMLLFRCRYLMLSSLVYGISFISGLQLLF